MSKTYTIKANQRMFYRWLDLSAKANKKVDAMFIFQNDAALTSAELNYWHKQTVAQIEEVQRDFEQVVKEMYALLDHSVEVIKEMNGS